MSRNGARRVLSTRWSRSKPSAMKRGGGASALTAASPIGARNSEDADYCDFVVIDNLLSAAECERLCQAFLDMSDRMFNSNEIDPYWNNRLIWYADIAA